DVGIQPHYADYFVSAPIDQGFITEVSQYDFDVDHPNWPGSPLEFFTRVANELTGAEGIWLQFPDPQEPQLPQTWNERIAEIGMIGLGLRDEFEDFAEWFFDTLEKLQGESDEGSLWGFLTIIALLNGRDLGGLGAAADISTDAAFSSDIVSPLIIDLDGDGVELIGLANSHAYFDLNLDSYAELTGWVSPDDAVLAFDSNGNGAIDDNSELFGDQTGFAHGFLALAAHDGNSDGVIDVLDAVFNDLIVWQDANGDGSSAASEMRSLADVGITSIDVGASSINETNEGHSVLWRSAVTWSDGSNTNIDDVYFENDTRASVALLPDNFEYHEDAFILPVLFGYGQIASTWVRHSEDATLRTDAEALLAQIAAGDIAGFKASFDAYLFKWAGVDGVDPDSRGIPMGNGNTLSYMDARELVFLEKAYGQEYTMFNYGDNIPRQDAAIALEAQFAELSDKLAARFLAQAATSDALLTSTSQAEFDTAFNGHLFSFLDGLVSVYSPGSRSLTGDLDPVFTGLVSGLAAGDFNLSLALDVLSLVSVDYQDDTAPSLVDQFHTFAAVDGSAAAWAISFASMNTEHSVVIDAADNLEVTAGDSAALVLTGLNAVDVAFKHVPGDDLVITKSDGTTITIIDQMAVSSPTAVPQIEFDDGTILDGQGIRNKAANDAIATGDVLGSFYAEHYEYALGDGSATITDYKGNWQSGWWLDDKLTFTDLNANDVTFVHAGGDDLTITMSDGAVLTIVDHFAYSGFNQIETIVFADGTTLGTQGIRNKAANDAMATGTVLGTSLAEHYEYALGDGSATITDYKGNWQSGWWLDDRLVFSDLTASDMFFTRLQSDDLAVNLNDGSLITITDFFQGSFNKIEYFDFSDGTTLTASDLANTAVGGSVGNDTMYFGSRDDSVDGHAGNDVIYGGNGNDTIYGGDGNDVLNGELGNDFHYGGAGDDYIYGNSGGDFYDGGSGTDTIDFTYYNGSVDIDLAAETQNFVGYSYSTSPTLVDFEAVITGNGNDIITGNDEDNNLSGGGGNDVLKGNLGVDILTGGTGADTFEFMQGDTGVDTVTDFNFTTDKLDIGDWAATGFGDLTITNNQQSSSSLYDITVANGSDSLVLSNVVQSDLAALTGDDFIFT
ncbi:MAG: calcium-binding protein, partial [Pseudomonadota bacterium]